MQSNNRKRTWDKSDSKSNKRKRGRKPLRRRKVLSRYDVYSRAGTQALRDIGRLRRYINTEMHYIDVNSNNISLNTTPGMALLNGCSLGDTATTRTGQSIKMDRCDLRFILTGDSTATRQFVRIIIVVDKQTNASAMAASDLLNSTSATTNIITPYTDGSQMRFVPLFDETFAISTTGQGVITKVVGLSTNQHVMFNVNNAGTVSDIITNSVYMIYYSDQSVNEPLLSFYSRIWFVDN